MPSDDDWQHKSHLYVPIEPGSQRYKELEAIREHEDQKRLIREQGARTFFENSGGFNGLLAAHEVDDQTKTFVIDAAAKLAAERRAGGPIEPGELGQIINDALAEAYKQQELQAERVAAAELEQSPEPLARRHTNPIPLSADAYRELEGRPSEVDVQADAVRDQQQQETDRRQSVDPATRDANDLEPSRTLNDINAVVGKRNEFEMAADEACLFEVDPPTQKIDRSDWDGWER